MRITKFIQEIIINIVCVPIIDVYYNGFWNYRKYLITHQKGRTRIYDAYLERCSASIGVKSQFKSTPVTPHGLHGIHISDGAIIGENCVIMQNVTIGSNTLMDTKRNGAPTVGDNVFIGANSSIIGGIKIGNNCRIGANCCVFTDVPDCHTYVMGGGARLLKHENVKNNKFYFIETAPYKTANQSYSTH